MYEVVPVPPGQLLESTVWDSTNNKILWVDIVEGNIFSYTPELDKLDVFNTGQQVGAVALRKNGGRIAALQNGFHEIDLANGAVKMIADPEEHLRYNRFNDGKCDPAGRFWAGTMSIEGVPDKGTLYALNGDYSISEKITGVSCSNGLAWSEDQSTFFFVDSPTQQVMAYDYDITTGDIDHGRVVVKIPDEEGMPDGMTIDSEGMLWIALWGGGKVQRYDPNTGKMLCHFTLPCSNITSCTFGGKQLTDMYITSARTGMTEEQLSKEPLAGSLFVIKDCGYTGLPAFVFQGK